MLVLLDRDGVINEDLPYGVTRLEEWRFLPGALEALTALTQAGMRVAVVTNQSCVAKGLLSQAGLDAIHQHLCDATANAGGRIDAIYCCTDHPDHPSPRRKPGAAMLLEALTEFGETPENTPFIGDAARDLQAATAAGCPAILVKTGKGQLTLNNGLPDGVQPIAVVENLEAAAGYVIHHFRQGVRA